MDVRPPQQPPFRLPIHKPTNTTEQEASIVPTDYPAVAVPHAVEHGTSYNWLARVTPGDWLKVLVLLTSLVGGWVKLGDRMNTIEAHLTAIDGYMQRHEQREIENSREIAKSIETRFERERDVTNRDIDTLRSSVATTIEGDRAAEIQSRTRSTLGSHRTR